MTTAFASYVSHKYWDDPRTEVLHELTLRQWQKDEGGDVESPTGWFALLSIPDLTDEELRRETDLPVTASQVIGYHIVREDSDGFVDVWEFPTDEHAQAEFNMLSHEYGQWAAQDEEI